MLQEILLQQDILMQLQILLQQIHFVFQQIVQLRFIIMGVE
jgi:hypothetical protein